MIKFAIKFGDSHYGEMGAYTSRSARELIFGVTDGYVGTGVKLVPFT